MMFAYALSAFLVFFFGSQAEGRPRVASQVCAGPLKDQAICKGPGIPCSFCHESMPPALNVFGADLKGELYKLGVELPEEASGLEEVFKLLEEKDSDGDGYKNYTEWYYGSLPGNKFSTPQFQRCVGECVYDPVYAYKKTWLSFCGILPEYEDFLNFTKLARSRQDEEIKKVFDRCLNSAYWMGKDGIVWELGHARIRPVGSVKVGEDEGIMPIVDYFPDYNLFVYSQIDGHDARDMIMADYTVSRTIQGQTTTYTRQTPQRLLDGQVMQPEYRVGLLSSFWNLAFYLNYTGIARVIVANAFSGHLGIDLANMAGLNPPDVQDSRFADYDSKGVTKPECAQCHTTIDPLSYPFRNYNGLTGTLAILQGQNAQGLKSANNLGTEENLTPLSYAFPRMDFIALRYPGINKMPETGYIFGQKVETLKKWAEVFVNSDAFASHLVKAYWEVINGNEPVGNDLREFEQLWTDLKHTHNYNVEAMLYDLIRSKAYGSH